MLPLNDNNETSPVLGFLGTGAILGPSGFSLIKDLSELDTLGELGISFLLFEQGLELSLDRLKALSKYAFGLGTLQVCFRFAFSTSGSLLLLLLLLLSSLETHLTSTPYVRSKILLYDSVCVFVYNTDRP